MDASPTRVVSIGNVRKFPEQELEFLPALILLMLRGLALAATWSAPFPASGNRLDHFQKPTEGRPPTAPGLSLLLALLCLPGVLPCHMPLSDQPDTDLGSCASDYRGALPQRLSVFSASRLCLRMLSLLFPDSSSWG